MMSLINNKRPKGAAFKHRRKKRLYIIYLPTIIYDCGVYHKSCTAAVTPRVRRCRSHIMGEDEVQLAIVFYYYYYYYVHKKAIENGPFGIGTSINISPEDAAAARAIYKRNYVGIVVVGRKRVRDEKCSSIRYTQLRTILYCYTIVAVRCHFLANTFFHGNFDLLVGGTILLLLLSSLSSFGRVWRETVVEGPPDTPMHTHMYILMLPLTCVLFAAY